VSETQKPGDEKLKNLAESLSEELGGEKPQVPVGTGGAGTSTIVQATSADATSKSDETLSLEDLDKILNEQDPSFTQNMNSLANDLSAKDQTLDVQGMNIDQSLLGIVDKDEEVTSSVSAPANAQKDGLSTKVLKSVNDKALATVGNITDATVHSAQYVMQSALSIPERIRQQRLKMQAAISNFLKWFKALSSIQKINLLLFVVVSLIMVVLMGRTIRGERLVHPAESPLLKSFEQVANRIEILKTDEPMEQFDSPLRNPEYVVLYKKMFVNLKSTTQNRNPMAAFEIFIEANSQESAIELKDRERQFKDVIARIFEAMPYDEIITAEGKNKLKLIIRRDLNQVINKGRVKKVYFKTLFYKS